MLTSIEAATVLAAAIMGGLAARVTVPTPRTVLAAAPWTVTAAIAIVAAHVGAYDTLAAGASPLAVTASIAALAAASWTACIELAALRDLPYRDRYLAVTGSAAAAILGGTLLLYVDFELLRFVWLLMAPVAAALLAVPAYFALGLIYTDALAELQLAGLYTIAVLAFDGAASAIVVEQLGGTETAVVTTALLRLVERVNSDPSMWTLLPMHLLIGVGFVGICGWIGRRRHEAAILATLVVSVAVLWSATVLLLSVALLG
jgi:hypothetical protein